MRVRGRENRDVPTAPQIIRSVSRLCGSPLRILLAGVCIAEEFLRRGPRAVNPDLANGGGRAAISLTGELHRHTAQRPSCPGDSGGERPMQPTRDESSPWNPPSTTPTPPSLGGRTM